MYTAIRNFVRTILFIKNFIKLQIEVMLGNTSNLVWMNSEYSRRVPGVKANI